MASHSFSRFAYFDTNILSELAKRPELWSGVHRYLTSQDLTLAITDQVSELSEVDRLHGALSRMLVLLPSAVIKPAHTVLMEEVAAHPGGRSADLLVYPLNALAFEPKGPRLFEEFLGSVNLREARRVQRESALRLPSRLAELKGNFPPSRSGVYIKEQADLFAWLLTTQWLAGTHRAFMLQCGADIEKLSERTFKSIRLFALVLFHKYYLGNREPTEASDFGDLLHLYAIPYCAVAVVERDLASVLNQVKRRDTVLDRTEIRNISFIRSLAGTG